MAQTTYFESHATGWHWYEPVPDVQPSPKPTVSSSMITTSTDPVQQVKAINQAISTAKAAAVLAPTSANVEKYIALQNAVNLNAIRFGSVWQQVIWQHPELNYSLNHPTSQIGKEAYLDEQKKRQETRLKNLSKEYGLFFFFAGSCPYCHKFSSIVKELETRYGLSVIPVSLDGGSLPEYPHPVKDTGQAASFGVNRWPALFLVNPYKRQIIPITFGLISEDEVSSRIVTLVDKVNKEKVAHVN